MPRSGPSRPLVALRAARAQLPSRSSRCAGDKDSHDGYLRGHLMSVTAINVSGMSVTVNTERGTWSMGAGQSRAAAGSGSGSLRKARFDQTQPRRSPLERADRAHLLPAPRRQARRALRWICPPPRANRGRVAEAPRRTPARRCCWTRRRITMLGEFRRDLSAATRRHRRNRSWEPELANWPTQPSRHRPMAR